MALRDRIRRLEKHRALGKEPPCPECNGQVLIEKIAKDG